MAAGTADPQLDRARPRSRSMAWPFLVFMAVSGMPVSYNLTPVPMLVTDVAAMTAAAASSQNTANSVVNMLLLGVLYGASGFMLLRYPYSVGAILRRHWPLPALLLLLGAGMLWSYQPEKVALNLVHNVGVVLVTLAAALHYRCDPWRLPLELGHVLGVNMLLQVAAIAVLPGYSLDWQGRWQGLTPHPNTLGALAYTTIWANASVLVCQPRTGRRRLHGLWCLLAVMALLGADSVTSKMSSLAALLLLATFHTLTRRRATPLVYVCGALLALAGLALYKLAESMIDLSWLFDLLGRDSQLTGRAAVWQDAFQAISARPLLGWSFDDHAHLIATAGMPYSSYHNGILDLAVSGGLAAVLLLSVLFLSWLLGLLKSMRVACNIGPCSAAFVLTYLLHNITEASFVAPRGQLWVIFLALLFLGACQRQPASCGRRP